jgi:hypothetical protein
MMNRRRTRTRIFRRFVLGLAVAAIVVPGAQAALDESNTVRSESETAGVALGHDDKTFAAVPDGGLMVRGDDKVIVSTPSAGLASDQYGYRRALPQDYSTRIVAGTYGVLPPVVSDRHIAVGDYGVLPALPSDRVIQPGDYGILPAADGDQPILVGRPQGSFEVQPGTADASDAWIVGLAGLGLVLVAFLAIGAVRSSRRVGEPATA